MVEIFHDIRKIYQFSAPCEELADYVEFFSESCSEATQAHACHAGFTVKMFPSHTPTFWINLGRPYRLTMGNSQYLIPARKDIALVRNNTVERHNHPADHIFSIKLFPGGLEAIFGMNQSVMMSRVVDLEEVLPASLIGQVRRLNDFRGRVKLLQDFFLCRLKNRKHDHYLHFVRQTIACYEAGNLRYNVNEMAAQMFTTSKTINRYFNQVIGTSPKNYFSILRARTALTAYVNGACQFVPDEFGYYDMSHFYREAIKFTGQRLAERHS